MRLHPHFRIREHTRSLVRRVRRFAATVVVLAVLFAGVVVGKNIFLGQLRSEIGKTFQYASLRMSYVPPAIIIDDIRSTASPPLFEARRVRVEIPFLSLLRNEKSVTVLIDRPRVRIRAGSLAAGPNRPQLPASLPFTILRGLVQDGTFSYESDQAAFEARGLRVLFTQRRDEFALKATSDSSLLTLRPRNVTLGGVLNAALSGKGADIKIERLSVEGPDMALKGEGRLRNLQNPEFDLDTRFDAEMATAAELLDLPFRWKGKAGGQGKLVGTRGEVTLVSDLNADGLILSGVPMGRIGGRLNLAFGRGGRVDLEIQKPDGPRETVAISFRGDRVEGEVKDVLLDPVMKDLQVPWPVKSRAWGTFSVEKGILEARAEFRDETLDREGPRFSFRGAADVRADLKTRDVLITTGDMQSVFARLEARSSFRVDGQIDTTIRGTVTDLKQAREFVSLILERPLVFPEIRGAGFADVRLTGRTADPKVTIKGSFQPAGFDLFDAAFAEGEATIENQQFDGKFRVDDPGLKGEIAVSAGPETTEANIGNAEGDIVKVFTALEIPVPLEGRASGDFHVVQTAASQAVTGTFKSPEVKGYGQTFKNVAGRLDWKDGTLGFPEIGLDLYGGRLQGRFQVGLASLAFDADLKLQNVDLSLLSPKTNGFLSLDLGGQGVFGQDRLGGRFTVKDFMVSPVQPTQAGGEFTLNYVQDELVLEARSAFLPGDNEAQARIGLPLSGNTLSGNLKGHWTNLDLLLPWTGAKGRLDFTADITGTASSPRVSGTVNAQGALMPFPRFAHAVTDYSGTAQIEDGRITVTEVKGKLGGGDVKGSGEIGLGPSGVETIDVAMDGKDMLVAPLERTRALVDGTARLIKDSRQFVLEGDFLFKRLTWRREIYEKFGFSSQPYTPTSREPGFFDNLSLNLHLRAADNALMDNSLGRASGRFDLTITGDVDDPVLLGDIEILKGNVKFQDQSFRVLSGRLSFFNPAAVDPYVDLRAETYVKDFRVTMVLSGPASRLRPEFTSSPPMSPEDILALLALGEAFKGTYSYSPEQSTSLSTASLLSFQIADQAKKRAEGLFTLDRFRIDPLIAGTSAEPTARLTVGKKLSRNLIFIYSTNLATQREEIYRMEWEISTDFSLVGVRNELGRVSFDLRFRKRF